tara:strand:- start:331 stop:1584 length:1254 start_codon:yes stop_codon:yes gene_type:complete
MSIQIRVPGDEGLYIPNEFLDSLMQPDVIKNALCKHFFEGNRDLMEKYWQTLKERELREFFRLYFGKTVEREERPFTFVVYGASGYTGSLVLEYIYRHVRGLGSEVTFALAGRTPSKLSDRLDEVLAKFPDATYRPEIFKADIANSMDIRKIVQKCLCVLNVAGPFIKTNAHLLVEACIDFDCDYVDVNGEVPFTHKLVPLHDWAKKKNVIICPNSAGAGGLPDLAAFFTAEELKKVTDAELKTLKCFITSNGGAPSGGTLATRAAMTAEMGKFVKIMGDPFALGGTVGDGKRPEDSDKVLAKVEYYPEFEGWSGPFTYAFYDTRLIRRSNWLMADLGEDPYGRHLSYSEHLLFPTEAVAKEITSANTSSKKEEEKLKKEGKLFKVRRRRTSLALAWIMFPEYPSSAIFVFVSSLTS